MKHLTPVRAYNFTKSHHVTHSLQKPIGIRRLTTKKIPEKKFWKTPPEVSIVGFSRLRNQDYCKGSRCIWFITICIGVGLCGWQLRDRTKYFLMQPIVKNVDIIRFSTIKFPSIYLCPGYTRTLLNSMASNVLEKCKGMLDHNCLKDPIVEAGFKLFTINDKSSEPVKRLWNMTFLNSSTVRVYKPCRAGDRYCTPEGKLWKVDTMFISSFWGGCIVLNTVHEEEYRGPFSLIEIEVYNWMFNLLNDQVLLKLNSTTDEEDRKNIRRSLDRPFVGAMLYLNHEYVSDQHHYMFYSIHDILQGYRTHVVVRKTVYDVTHGKKAACVPERTSVNCFNECVERKMSSVCRMPYSYRNGTRDCLFKDNFLNVHVKNYHKYTTFNLSECNCLPTCVVTKFIASTDVIDKMPGEGDRMWVKVYFADKTYERTTENIGYNICKFLSDVGGYVGFFLGFCILNILEFVEFFVYFLTI